MNYRNLYEDLRKVHAALNIDGRTSAEANVPLAGFLLGSIMTKAMLRAEEQEAALAASAAPAYPTGLPAAPGAPGR